MESVPLDPFSLYGLFKYNLINWLILLGLLAWAWNKYTPSMFQSRKERIETALAEAAAAKEKGEAFFREQQAKVANVEQESQRMLEEAKQLAAQLEQQMREQTVKEVADLQRKIESQIASERQLAITELRSAAARASIKLTEQILPTLMTAEAKSKLLSQFMEQLDSGSEPGNRLSAGHLESIH